jgi:hypothetical protein
LAELSAITFQGREPNRMNAHGIDVAKALSEIEIKIKLLSRESAKMYKKLTYTL